MTSTIVLFVDEEYKSKIVLTIVTNQIVTLLLIYQKSEILFPVPMKSDATWSSKKQILPRPPSHLNSNPSYDITFVRLSVRLSILLYQYHLYLILYHESLTSYHSFALFYFSTYNWNGFIFSWLL